MRLLGIDTCGPVIGVGLRVEERVLVRSERVRRGAEARLIPWVQQLCAEAGIALAQLDGIAVANGPGAFTGLRVGLASAIGLGLSLDRPLLPVLSLDSRAAAVGAQAEPVLAMLDARKRRVYAAWYQGGRRCLAPADLAPEHVLDRPTARERMSAEGPAEGLLQASTFVATGEGARVYQQEVEAAGGRVHPRAEQPGLEALCALGARKLEAGRGVAPTEVQPRYLRAPDARPPARRARRPL